MKLAGVMDWLERIGNRLPDPAVLFVWCAVLVALASGIGARAGWTVQPVQPVAGSGAGAGAGMVLEPAGEPVRCRSLLTSEGIWWAAGSMVENFIRFPPLGVVIVCMLGVGVAEKAGLIGAALRALMLVMPRMLLAPTVVFLGVNASLAADAGFIVLPPLAALMYKGAGRSPLAGIAAAYAGVAGGFSANLLITSLDPLLSTLTTAGARIVDPRASVSPACNWWFMIASTFLLTLVGWAVSSRVIEPRLAGRGEDDGGPATAGARVGAAERLTRAEVRGLVGAGAAAAACVGVVVLAAAVPGWPLWGVDPERGSARWIQVIVPIIFALFLVPGVVYGRLAGTLGRVGDAARMMGEAVAGLGPMLVLAFFAAQFIAWFGHSNLDRMLAFGLGTRLAGMHLPPVALLAAVAVAVMVFNLLIASASAKWALLAPILVPMLMLAGIGPAATQAAYRVGDSVTNMVTPLNPYLVVVLMAARRYSARAGTGTVLSLMAPYSAAFAVAWVGLLVVWMEMGWGLGPG